MHDALPMHRLASKLAAATLLAIAVPACAARTEADTPAQSSADVVSEPGAPSNFREVRPGLYRGGHPDTAGIAFLKAKGVERIVNLEVANFVEATPWAIRQELDDAKAAGLVDLRYPMSAFEPALSDRFDQQMDEITSLLKTATPEHPIYVHCKHGQDRTGLVIGLERVLGEGWKPEAAFDEMVAIGFHTFFLGLDEYFEEKTGWK